MHPAKHSNSDFSNKPISNTSMNTYNQNLSMNKQIKIGNYILGATIGKGNSAVVKLATHCLTKQKVAIKIFDKNGLDNEKQIRLRREIDSMKRLKHQNIIKLYEIMETSKLICLVTEYASNGELYNHVLRKKRLSEREARSILKQIVAAVHFCHYNQIVHRDIKVENLLLDTNFRVKLADFGFSTQFEQGDLLDVWCGSPPYCAPELYLALLYDGPKADIWSLGVVLYVLVCGYLPFEAQSYNLLRSQVVNGAYKLPFFLSEDCKNLINGILQIDPSKRFSMDDIINHRWLKFDNECSILPSVVQMPSEMAPESALYQEFRKLISKIEKISIKDLKIDENIIKEISKYGIDPEDVINSIRNNEFDSNAGVYFLLESKYANQSDISSSSSGQHIFRLKSEARSDDVISTSSDGNYEPTCRINVHSCTDDNLSLNEEARVDEEENEEDDDDDGGDQMIEELGRQYLNRHNSIRRHTIGTNTNDAHFNSDLMKSTECLPMLNEIDMLDAAGTSSAAASAQAEAASLSIKNSLINSNVVNGDLNHSLLNTLLINNASASGGHSPQAPLSGSYVKDLGIFGTKTQSEVAQHLKNHLSNNPLNAANSSVQQPAANPFLPGLFSNYNHLGQPEPELLNVNYENDNFDYNSCLSTSPSSKQPMKQKNHLKLNHPIRPKQPKLNSMNQYLSPPNIAGRRASDGGSNISLFNQFYSLKNPYANNSNIYQSNASSKQSRGSITSGIPIFNMNPLMLEQNQSNTICEMPNHDESEDERANSVGGYEGGGRYNFGGFQNKLNRVASLSSEDDDNLKANATNSDVSPSSISRFHRKSKSRHEPYMDTSASFSNSSTGNILPSAFGGKSPVSKSREQSISSSTAASNSIYSNSHLSAKDLSNSFAHRASEPNPLDLIFAHRARLEKIYNQSLKQGDVPLAKELKLLQQENPFIDESTKVRLQNQHENVMSNFSKLRTSMDIMLSIDRSAAEKFQTPKSSLSSTTSEDSTSNGSFSTLRNISASPTSLLGGMAAGKSNKDSPDVNLMLNNNLDAITLADQPVNAAPNALTIGDLFGLNKTELSTADLMKGTNLLMNCSSINPEPSNDSMSQQASSAQMLNPSALQMIQEEQVLLLSSPSTSLSSSASITPRMSSSAHFNPGQGDLEALDSARRT